MKKIHIAYLTAVLFCTACTSEGSQDSPQPQDLRVGAFTTYYCFDHSDIEGLDRNMLRYLNLDFPTQLADTAALHALQQDLISFITGVSCTNLDSALYRGLTYDPSIIRHLPSSTEVQLLPFDSLLEYGEGLSWHHQRTLTTTYNAHGLYACCCEYDLYEGGAHGMYGVNYALYRLTDGHRIRLEDLFSSYQCELIYWYIFNHFEVDHYYRENIQSMYSLGLVDSCLVIHYNPYAIGCFADGDSEVRIPVCLDSLTHYVRTGAPNSEYMESIIPQTYGFEWYFETEIRRVSSALMRRDAKELTRMVSYPFYQTYPIKHISCPQDFIDNFDIIMPAVLPHPIDTTTLMGWEHMGWRGFMYDSGMIWLDEDGETIRSIAYDNDLSDDLFERLCDEERQLLGGLPQNFIPSLCYLAKDSSFLVHVGYWDTSDEDAWGDCIIRVIHRGHSLSDPTYLTDGKIYIEGSCGNYYYVARQDDTVIHVWNSDCGFRETNPSCYGCGFGTVSPDATAEDCYRASISNTQMTPSYLRDIALWW